MVNGLAHERYVQTGRQEKDPILNPLLFLNLEVEFKYEYYPFLQNLIHILDSNNPPHGPEQPTSKLDFNEVWNRTTETNATVYFGNCGEISEDLVRSYFERYGQIVEIRVFKEKGYAFIR